MSDKSTNKPNNKPIHKLKFRIWDKINNKYSNIPQLTPCNKDGLYIIGGEVEIESPFMEDDGNLLFEGDMVGTPEGDYYTVIFYDGVWFLSGDNGELLEFEDVEESLIAIYKIGTCHDTVLNKPVHTEVILIDVDGEGIEIVKEGECQLIELEGVTFDVTGFEIAEIKNIIRNFKANQGGIDD